MNFYQKMGISPLKKRVNRDKCSFTTKQRMLGVFAIYEIFRYRWTRFAGSRTLCHPVWRMRKYLHKFAIIFFLKREYICMGCVMWAARSQTPSFCSSSSPQTSKLPDWRTGLSSFTSKHVFLQTRRNSNFKWKFKKRKENWSKSTTLQFISVHQVYLLCFSSGDTHIQHVSGRSVLLR